MAAGCATYVLIGSDHSLFTGKLRVYLMYKGIPFEQMTASKDAYLQVIVPRTGVTFIPVLVCPDRTSVLQDTHAIIQNLEQRFPQYPILPSTPCQSLTSQLLELYGDEWLLLPAMHYRWSFPEQLQLLLYQFGATNSPTAPYKQQLAIGRKVSARFSSMLPALGITEASIPAIQNRFHWQLAVLQHHLEQHQFLLSNSSPCSGEFGLMGPLFAHLFKDPVPQAIIKMHAPLVANWVERVCGLSVSGQQMHQGTRAATSYMTWRAALIINWFEELPESDRQAVLGFLHTVSKVGIMSGAALSASSPANSSAVSAATQGRDKGNPGVGGSQVVDAVATFLEMRDLVKSCGVFGRVRNRVAVKPTGELGLLLMSCDAGSNVSQPAAVFSRL
eukprot:gene9462-9625_t